MRKRAGTVTSAPSRPPIKKDRGQNSSPQSDATTETETLVTRTNILSLSPGIRSTRPKGPQRTPSGGIKKGSWRTPSETPTPPRSSDSDTSPSPSPILAPAALQYRRGSSPSRKPKKRTPTEEKGEPRYATTTEEERGESTTAEDGDDEDNAPRVRRARDRAASERKGSMHQKTKHPANESDTTRSDVADRADDEWEVNDLDSGYEEESPSSDDEPDSGDESVSAQGT